MVSLSGLQLDKKELAWIDRTGKIIGSAVTTTEGVRDPAVSPDGIHVAMDGKQYTTVLIQDMQRNTTVDVGKGSERAVAPVWLQDGKSVAFACRQASNAVCVTNADGTGTVSRFPIEFAAHQITLSPDGKLMAAAVRNANGNSDINVGSLQDGAKEPFLSTSANEDSPQISPDGHYIAYQSDESGRNEVYVRSFSRGEGRWQVSVNGGTNPKWNPRGGEIFYLEGDKLMSVPLAKESGFKPGLPHELFSGSAVGSELVAFGSALYDVSPDGQRFLVIRIPRGENVSIDVVQNWLAIANR